MNYSKKFSSLEERAIREVAINLCQDDSFKEMALCLEKPTYGFFYLEGELPVFVSNPKKLLKLEEGKTHYKTINYVFNKHENINIWQQHKKPPFINDPRILSIWEDSGKALNFLGEEDIIDEIRVGKWFTRIEELSKKLTEKLPQSLRLKISVWIKRIALEYISYCRRQELLFGISRYFLMNFLTRGDWMETCRLDEKKLAERLVKDERLTLLNRYHIACVYCLLDDISRLWNDLTEREKHYIDKDKKSIMSRSANFLVQLWSSDRNMRENPSRYYCDSYEENFLWCDIVRRLIVFGNLSILKPFWKGMEESERQDRVIDMAVKSLECCSILRSYKSRNILLSNKINSSQYTYVIYYTLQSHYCELILFFLSEMNDDQQLSFFEHALQIEDCNILECFLDWTLQDHFLQTINRLWEIMHMDRYYKRKTVRKFEDCFAFLANLYSANDNITLTLEFSENFEFYYDYLNETYQESFIWDSFYDCYCRSLFIKENQNYVYRSLLWKLWKETPQSFKQHLFDIQTLYPNAEMNSSDDEDWDLETDSSDEANEKRFMLFKELSKRSPFLKEDEALFKLIFSDLPKTDRTPMIYSKTGEDICSILLEKGKVSFVDWLLTKCLEKYQICSYKNQFIQSESGIKLCFFKLLQENGEKSLADLLDWFFESDAEKTQFKQELANKKCCLTECKLSLSRGEFEGVERIMNFCLQSEELKKNFKTHCTESTCVTLVGNWKIELVDKILMWCFDAEENINNFKTIIFSQVGIKTHCRLVFLERWQDVKLFYQWFDLSPQEIRKLKYDTALKAFEKINRKLYFDVNMKTFVEPFCWCLTDEKMVTNFKNDVEKEYLVNSVSNEKKEGLSCLVKELLYRIKKDTWDKTTVRGPVLRKRKEKQSPKEEFLPPRKHK